MSVDAERTPHADIEHWWNAARTAGLLLYGVFFPLAGLGLGIWVYRAGARYDYIYAEHFPLTLAFLSFSWFSVLYLSLLFANFRPPKPVRILREAIMLLAILYAAFGLHSLAAYLFWGDDMSFVDLMRGFGGRMKMFLWIPALSMVTVFLDWLGKTICAARAKRGKTPKWRWFNRKGDDFLKRHLSWVVSGTREFLFLSVRYALWGVALSALALEAMIVVWFMVHPPSCASV